VSPYFWAHRRGGARLLGFVSAIVLMVVFPIVAARLF
jgi:hypothetical protein